jgi:thiamine-phosphate pyrophosphorylase
MNTADQARHNRRRPMFDHGLYCITGEKHSQGRSAIEVVRQLIDAGVKIIQYREKEKTDAARSADCHVIRDLTTAGGVIFIVNDDPILARSVGADGVHVGQGDMSVEAVRQIVGPDMIIGLSTHTPEQALEAVRHGVDYIGVGPLHPTKSKKDVCAPVGLTYLEYAVRNIPIPLVAIGGIKLHNMDEVLARGARCVAMVTEIIGAPDIAARVRAVERVLARHGLVL